MPFTAHCNCHHSPTALAAGERGAEVAAVVLLRAAACGTQTSKGPSSRTGVRRPSDGQKGTTADDGGDRIVERARRRKEGGGDTQGGEALRLLAPLQLRRVKSKGRHASTPRRRRRKAGGKRARARAKATERARASATRRKQGRGGRNADKTMKARMIARRRGVGDGVQQKLACGEQECRPSLHDEVGQRRLTDELSLPQSPAPSYALRETLTPSDDYGYASKSHRASLALTARECARRRPEIVARRENSRSQLPW